MNRRNYSKNIDNMKFNYDYPDGIDFHPGHKLSNKLVEYILDIAKNAMDVQRKASGEWDRVENSMEAYVDLNEYEKSLVGKHSKRPVGLVVPMLYAAHETMMTYFSGMFTSHPIHKIRGLGSVDAVAKGALLERVLTWQHIMWKTGLDIQTVISDSIKYGSGFATLEWRKHVGKTGVQEEITELLEVLLQDSLPDHKVGDVARMLEDKVLWEGNKLIPIDRYKFFIDPAINYHNLEKARYFGWWDIESVYDLSRREKDDEEYLFNLKYLLHYVEQGNGNDEMNDFYQLSKRGSRHGGQGYDRLATDKTKGSSDVITIEVDLIPRDWKLGDSTTPERWRFRIGARKVIIQAHKCNYMHNMPNVLGAFPLNDGHGQIPISVLFQLMGLEDTACWLLNTRLDNVAKTMNDMLIVNPHAFEWEDVINQAPGKLIRLSQQFYYNRAPLEAFIKQLQVSDVTQGHIGDFGMMSSLIKELSGTTNLTQGIMQGMPERPTERGMDIAARGSTSRMQYLGNRIGLQFLQDLGIQEAYNTIQFMGEDVIVETHGRDQQKIFDMYGIGTKNVKVRPTDLDFPFMVMPPGGILPGMENVQAITQVMQTLMNSPDAVMEVTKNNDITRLFSYWARLSGFEDVEEFERTVPAGGGPQVSVQPDEQVQQQVQAGNMVPAGEFLGDV